MKKTITLALTRDLFQIMKQFSHLKLQHSAIDGLKRSEYELLLILILNINNDKKTFTVTEISSLLQITPAGVTHLINPLEEAGYIERLHSPNDRRVVRIGLTDKGTKAAEILISEVHENLIGLVNHLGEEDSRTLIRLMSKSIDFFASYFEG